MPGALVPRRSPGNALLKRLLPRDVPTATAILDRFLHHSEIITFTGKSYRLKDRQDGSKPAKAPTGSATEKEGEETAQE